MSPPCSWSASVVQTARGPACFGLLRSATNATRLWHAYLREPVPPLNCDTINTCRWQQWFSNSSTPTCTLLGAAACQQNVARSTAPARDQLELKRHRPDAETVMLKRPFLLPAQCACWRMSHPDDATKNPTGGPPAYLTAHSASRSKKSCMPQGCLATGCGQFSRMDALG